MDQAVAEVVVSVPDGEAVPHVDAAADADADVDGVDAGADVVAEAAVAATGPVADAGVGTEAQEVGKIGVADSCVAVEGDLEAGRGTAAEAVDPAQVVGPEAVEHEHPVQVDRLHKGMCRLMEWFEQKPLEGCCEYYSPWERMQPREQVQE